MDQRTRKLMTKVLHPRNDVDRLCVKKRGRKRGLAIIEDSVDTSIQQLEDYIQKRGGRLITATKNNTNDTRISGTTIIRKQLNGCFKRLTSDISHEKKRTRLRKGNLKKETESLLIAAQNNVIRTNHIKSRIDKRQQNSRCRLCGESDETINHISECNKLEQKEYKTWHEWVGKVIHWELRNFDHTNKWYMYNPESVLKNETHKLLWDFEIQTDHQISARRPDLIITKKEKRTCRIVDFAVLADHRVKLKECENRDKYLDLARELKKPWNMKVTIIPIQGKE